MPECARGDTDLVPTRLGGRAWGTDAFALRGTEKKPQRKPGGGLWWGACKECPGWPLCVCGLIRGPGQGACEDWAVLPRTVPPSLRTGNVKDNSAARAPAGLAIAAAAGFRPAPRPSHSSAARLTWVLAPGALILSQGSRRGAAPPWGRAGAFANVGRGVFNHHYAWCPWRAWRNSTGI